jgi:catechol 2,3-dioxygenase-like lactoylglutathione lyase family enzyme
MIRKLSHVSIFVLDQDRALAFYTQKLGFEVRTDSKIGDFRWLTVGPKDQPDLEIIMLPPTPGPMLDPTTAKQLKELVAKGGICPGAFETDDVRGDYEEMKKRGVVFKSPPTERHYGIEAVFQDDSGNWFSLTQRKR